MYKLTLLRHGESLWNKENRFTGWTDVDLTEAGQAQARQAGRLLKQEGLTYDIAYTSVLKRAIRTLWNVLDEMDLMWIPIQNSWRLNERHYGALQGLNKSETSEKYGVDQVAVWRRSFDTPPPALTLDDPRHAHNDPRYHNLDETQIPLTESLKDTIARMLPYWEETIAPTVKSGKQVIITAHGSSLRALVQYLDKLTNEEVVELNIPVGTPLIYELDDDLKPIKHYYLGNQEEIQKAIEAVANQAKPKATA